MDKEKGVLLSVVSLVILLVGAIILFVVNFSAGLVIILPSAIPHIVRLYCMKKTWIIRALLLIAYCIPFAFLSVNGDAASGTMLFYGVMIAGFALLCWGALKTNNVAVLYIGNGLSFVSSYAVAKMSGLELMGHYFKPFTYYSLIVAISVIVLIVHTIIVLIYREKKRANSK